MLGYRFKYHCALKLDTFILHLIMWMLYSFKCNGTDFCFDGKNEDHRLNYTVLKRLHANSGPECILMCLTEDECCRSVNYKKKTLCGEKTNCELLHGVADEEPDVLIKDSHFDHYVLLRPLRNSARFNCPDSPCLNGGTCVGGCGNETSFCNCSSDYGGKYCNFSCGSALRHHGNKEEYGIVDRTAAGNVTALFSFTVSFWVKPKLPTNQEPKAILSYAYDNVDNGLSIFLKNGKLQITLTAKSKKTEKSTAAEVNPGKFHHVCITMKYSNGPLLVYVNGSMRANVSNANITGGFPGDGIWVIGQDQDSLGGGFEVANAFAGELTELHVWDRVLSLADVKYLASSCAANMTGNYLAYSDFVIKENVETFQPPCCGRHIGNN